MKRICTCLLCLILVLAAVTSFSSCSIYGQRRVADPSYMAARQDVLTAPRPTESKDFFFYTAIVDIDAGDHVRTLVCHFDGTTELHLSTGEVYAGLEVYDPAIVGMTQDFLKGLSQNTDYIYWQDKTSLALPRTGCHSIYAAGTQGIYHLSLNPQKIPATPVSEIYGLYMLLYEAVTALVVENTSP